MKIISNEYNANLPMNKWPTKGGPAKFANLFSKDMLKRGHQWVGVVDKYEGKVIKTELVCETKNKWFEVVYLPNKFFSKKFTHLSQYKDPLTSGSFLIKQIKKVLLQEKPDVVFINGNSCFAWTLLIAASQLKIPIIALHAGIWSVEIDLYADLFSKTGVKILKEMEIDFATLPNYNVFLNETSKNYFIKNVYKIPKEKILIIPLPCETKKEIVVKNKKLNKKINVGIVARWDRIKNHQAFLAVAKELRKIDANYNFFAVTNIPQTHFNKDFKEDYVKNINVLAPMEQNALQSFYKKMSFMILPSLFDVSPHVVLEAALNGTPTFISKNVGYAKLLTENNLKHFIIDFSNPKKSAKIINALKNKSYSTKFVKHLKKIHNTKNVLAVFENLFKKNIYENRAIGVKS